MQQLYEIEISVYRSEVLLELGHNHLFVYGQLVAFMLQWQSLVTVVDLRVRQGLKYLLSEPS